MIKMIYLDMDGVIANFDKGYSAIFGINCRDDPKRKNWNSFILDYEGFSHLDMMPDAKELLDFLQSLDIPVTILSCAGRLETFAEVSAQKIKWLERNNLGHLPRVFTFTKAEKGNLASSTGVLIDDSIQCIEPFKARGGHTIHHTSAANTIQELEELLTSCVQL